MCSMSIDLLEGLCWPTPIPSLVCEFISANAALLPINGPERRASDSVDLSGEAEDRRDAGRDAGSRFDIETRALNWFWS